MAMAVVRMRLEAGTAIDIVWAETGRRDWP